MTCLVCLDCTTAFAVGVSRCPHCGSERHAEDGTAAALGLHARGRIEEDKDMPKITRHGGPSDRADIVPGAENGGEESSPGSSGETSSPKPQPSTETNAAGPRRRARTTGSRSGRGRTVDSAADSTATGGPETAADDE